MADFPGTVAWRRVLPAWFGVLAAFSGQISGQSDVSRVSGRAALIADVEQAFARIEVCGEHLNARANGLIPKPRYRTSARNFFGLRNHFQGIQRLPGSEHVALSGSNRSPAAAELFIVRLGRDPQDGEVVARIGLDPVMEHAGGLSVEGTVLAVPLHGGTPRHGRIVFYDVADPEHPRKLAVEVERPGRKAPAVALTRLDNGRFLTAVLSAYDGLPRRIDFYLSRTTVLDDGFQVSPVTWHVSAVRARPGQKRTFSHFQTINFIRQADNRLYLVGFHNSLASPASLPGRDYADLYEVIFPAGTIDSATARLEVPSIVKVANRMLRCRDGYCNLDAAAGLFVDPEAQTLSVYAAPGWLDGNMIKITVYRSSRQRH